MRLILMGLLLIAPLSAQAPISLHIQAGDPDAPFVDPILKDSARDLNNYLRGKKVIRLVPSGESATVIVRITTRFNSSRGSVITAPAPNVAVAVPLDNTTLQAVLQVGDFKHELIASGDTSWRLAARRMAQQIERWVKENQAKLQP